MNTRRGFLGSLALGTAALLTSSHKVLAKSGQEMKKGTQAASSVLRGLVFSAAQPGMWKGKDKSHAPKISVDGLQVTLRTIHGMTPEHYIVRHTLLDAKGELIGATTFSPNDKAYSSYRLPKGYKGEITASSFCNKHDLWISRVEVKESK